MSEDFEPVAEEQQTVALLSHRRILLEMAATIVLGSLAGLVFVSARFGFGVLIGGILSILNYYWLKRSIKAIFDKAICGEKPRFLATKYILRYVAFGLVLAVVYLTDTFPVVAVLLGLASFAFVIMIEGFMRLFSGVFKKKEI